MPDRRDTVRDRLLNDWQRDFPIEPRPFRTIAAALETTEDDVIDRLASLQSAGTVSRVGATCRPGTAGASTLAAVAAPDWRIEEVAGLINAVPGVNHSYLRENTWNIWFVATGPDRAHVDDMLERIGRETGLRVLDLPMLHSFRIDLGFALDGSRTATPAARAISAIVLEPGDRAIMQALSDGLALVPRPFADLAARLDRTEDDILARIAALSENGALSRVGVIVRHRALGWTSNAMVVWQVPEDQVMATGTALAAVPGVTLCYQRRPIAGLWPYTLYCMIHGRSRAETLGVLDTAAALPELAGIPHDVLFSLRCFKQTGATIKASTRATA